MKQLVLKSKLWNIMELKSHVGTLTTIAYYYNVNVYISDDGLILSVYSDNKLCTTPECTQEEMRDTAELAMNTKLKRLQLHERMNFFSQGLMTREQLEQ